MGNKSRGDPKIAPPGMPRQRAYTREQFERLAAESASSGCEIAAQEIGMEVRLKKP
ncbi:MAG TPA: hypothetical protein VFA09_03690 [Ktedonobacteraceae bacterium]|jgi:hypothetical protein|nr:hypothetical protein [Ktedonobacteraceae bacterium]